MGDFVHKQHREAIRFKEKYPVPEALLRREFKNHYGNITCWMEVSEVDGDILVDAPGLPEPIILKAGQKQWLWQSEADFVILSEDNVV